MEEKHTNGKLHKAHFWADIGLSVFSVVGLIAILNGFEEVLNTWFKADLIFHIVILIVLPSGILAERILHRYKHTGVIAR